MEVLIICGIVVFLAIVIFLLGYMKAPPDTAYIISGMGKKRIPDWTGRMESPAD